MNLEYIRSFIAVAKHHNFTKAANELNIGQPSLSRQVSELEKYFGLELIDRSSRVLRLTDAGLLLYEEGCRLLDMNDTIESKMRDVKNGEIGNVKIALLPNIDAEIPRMIKSVIKGFPSITANIVSMQSEPMIKTMLNGDIDIGITYEYALLSHQLNELNTVPIQSTHFCALISNEDELTKNDYLSISDLADHKILLLKNNLRPGCIREILKHEPYGENSIVYADTIDTLLLKAELGMGIAIIPDFSASRLGGRDLKTMEFSDLDTNERLMMIWSNSEVSPSVHNFIVSLNQKIREKVI